MVPGLYWKLGEAEEAGAAPPGASGAVAGSPPEGGGAERHRIQSYTLEPNGMQIFPYLLPCLR